MRPIKLSSSLTPTKTIASFPQALPEITLKSVIFGLSSCVSIFTGGFLAWIIGIPLYGLLNGLPDGESATAIASFIWSSHIRMMGIGTMVIGGIWTVFALLKPIQKAVISSMEAFRKAIRNKRAPILRTERDIPFPYVFTGTIVLGIPHYRRRIPCFLYP